MNFLWGGTLSANLFAPAAVMPLLTLAKRCRRLSPLLAAPAALLLTQGEAKAVLTYNIFESAGNVVAQANGSLNLTGAETLGTSIGCENEGIINSSIAVICTGFDISLVTAYKISGPTSFNGSVSSSSSIFSGISTIFWGSIPIFGSGLGLDPSCLSNTPIVSSFTFNGETLASLGFTTTGLIGTWTLDGTSESIQVILEAPTPPGVTVPGPLPLLGAAAAFGWSRRLRNRITTPLITLPQA